MSIESWKLEFYPKPASRTRKSEAITHSFQKWTGFLPVNLARHNVFINNEDDLEDEYGKTLQISCKTCALCYHYMDKHADGIHDTCWDCPLYQARGCVMCDVGGEDDVHAIDGERSPFNEFTDNHNPVPMILWLDFVQQMEAYKHSKQGK